MAGAYGPPILRTSSMEYQNSEKAKNSAAAAPYSIAGTEIPSSGHGVVVPASQRENFSLRATYGR